MRPYFLKLANEMKKAIIFDLDGTLLDTLTDIMESVNNILEKYNFPTHTKYEYQYFLGNGIEILTKKAFPRNISTKEFNNYFQEVKQEYQSRQTLKTKPYSGIIEMLKELNKKGISIAILSNKPHEFTIPTIAHFFKEIKFDVVFGSRNNIARKPSSEAVYEILEILNVKAEECYFIGDSETDMQTGVNSGIDAIGVSWGFRTIDEMMQNGAKYIIDKPDEIISILKD